MRGTATRATAGAQSPAWGFATRRELVQFVDTRGGDSAIDAEGKSLRGATREKEWDYL